MLLLLLKGLLILMFLRTLKMTFQDIEFPFTLSSCLHAYVWDLVLASVDVDCWLGLKVAKVLVEFLNNNFSSLNDLAWLANIKIINRSLKQKIGLNSSNPRLSPCCQNCTQKTWIRGGKKIFFAYQIHFLCSIYTCLKVIWCTAAGKRGA